MLLEFCGVIGTLPSSQEEWIRPVKWLEHAMIRIDHLLVKAPLRHRVVWAEIDREARKGKPVPSDHAPLAIDLDSPGHPFDAGWTSADSRIATRLR